MIYIYTYTPLIYMICTIYAVYITYMSYMIHYSQAEAIAAAVVDDDEVKTSKLPPVPWRFPRFPGNRHGKMEDFFK